MDHVVQRDLKRNGTELGFNEQEELSWERYRHSEEESGGKVQNGPWQAGDWWEAPRDDNEDFL